MENESLLTQIDAVPRKRSVNIYDDTHIKNENVVNSVLDELTVEDFKSVFFLLMDYVGPENFLNLTKQDKNHLKQNFCKIHQQINNDSILVELFGVLKMYKKLKMLNTCYHVYKKYEDRKFNKIDTMWKMLYKLCEEITDQDLEVFKRNLPDNVRDEIVSAEDWFCNAFQKKVFSKADFSQLKILFNNYPRCLEIIQSYEVKSYSIRTPTADSHCGIAVIFNFDTFDNTEFENRKGSDIDARSMTNLWHVFGFTTEVHSNLSYSETLEKLKHYSEMDHSNYDAFVCCILSHGKPSSIISSDGEEVPLPLIIGEITNKCPTLDGKPKLFFIQACQGINISEGFGRRYYQLKTPEPVKTCYDSQVPPRACDVLVAMSTINGFVSFRRVKDGSFFIQELHKSMMNFGDKLSILDVMIEVNNSVRKISVDLGPGGPRNAEQIVSCTNTLGKTLILKKRIP